MHPTSSQTRRSGESAKEIERLQRENEALRRQLGEAEQALQRLREGRGEAGCGSHGEEGRAQSGTQPGRSPDNRLENHESLERAEDHLRAARVAALNLMEDAVADRHRAEQAVAALRESEERFRQMADSAPMMVWVSEPDGSCSFISRSWLEFTGQTPEQAQGRGWMEAIHRSDRALVEIAFQEASSRAGEFRIDYRLRRADGAYRWTIAAAAPRKGARGEFLGFIGSVIDITDRKEAEEALRQSERRFRATFENAAVGIALQAPDGGWLRVNAKMCDFMGYRREELLGMNYAQVTHPEDLEEETVRWRRLLAGEIASFWMEKRYLRKDGSCRWAALTVSLVRRPGGEPEYAIQVVRDISLRKQAEADRDASRQRLAGIVESAMDAIISIDSDQRIVLFNRAAEKMFRCPEADARGSPIERFIPERFRPAHRMQVETYGKSGRTMRGTGMLREPMTALRVDGEEFPIEASISRTAAGGELLLTVILRDITERVQAENALRESEERMRLAAQATGFGTYDFDPESRSCVWSSELFAICGVPSTLAPDMKLMRDLVHPADRGSFDASVQSALDPGGPGRHELEFRLVRSDGEERWVRNVGRTFFEAEAGEGEGWKAVRVIGTIQDITSLKQTELRLQATVLDLREAQAELVRKERLATLGQLAGSVAHEMRTPLNVISNTVYFLKEALPQTDGDIRESFEEMERAVRSSDLIISEMLDFVREPSQTTTDFAIGRAMVRALELVPIPESLRLLAPEEGQSLMVRANEDQVVRIFINLIQNAIQAMPQGGELEIAASAAKGNRVSIKVRDTGQGIPQANLSKIFEPLFTTKTRGIGLGLAISHRYAKLNRGWLFVESTVGKGTVFRVILNSP